MSEPRKNWKARILLVSELKIPRWTGNYCLNDCFRADVATLGEDDLPRNWTKPYFWERIPNDTGGCTIQAWSKEPGQWDDDIPHWRTTAPQVHSDSIEDYQSAVAALKMIGRRLAAIQKKRGSAVDGIHAMCRWIEATGITQVYYRPEKDARREWLSEGDWISVAPSIFYGRLRNVLTSHITEKFAAEAAA